MIILRFNVGTADITKQFQLPESATEYISEIIPEGTEVEVIVKGRGEFPRNLPQESDKSVLKRFIDLSYANIDLED